MTNSTTFPGTLTCPTSLVSNVMTMGTTKTFVVTMTNASGANKYYIDGYLQASLVLHQGQTYIFDLSSGTLSGHPFEFSTTNNGSHGGGSVYSTGITTTGTYASSEKRTFVVSASTPTTLYYYCTAHSGMGGSVSISSEAELLVSGGAEFIGTGTIKLPSGTTSERPATGINGMIRYNTSIGYLESYTGAGWGAIASPPVVTGVSPVSVAGGSTATQVFTVTGTGFDTNLSIKLVGADGTEYSVFSTTYVSGLQTTFKMGANGATNGYDAAQKPFKVKVIGGSGLVSTLDTPTITIPAPTITNVSPTTLAYSAVGSQTITVTGTNFTASMESGNKIQVLGANGSTLYNVNSATVASATSITFKLAASGGSLSSGQLAQRPYKVRVTGGAGLTATSTATVGFTGLSWSSPASGAVLSYVLGASSSQNLVATDEVGGTNVTFSIVSGSVSGLSIGSTGASPATYGGTGNSGTTGINVTFRVTDNVTGTTLDRTFSIKVVDELYPFNSHTFSNSNGTGRYGASIAQFRSTYSSTVWEQNNAWFAQAGSVAGFQLWTVPATGTYRIHAKGAYGGNGGYTQSNGIGGYVKADFALSKNTKLVIICGHAGQYSTNAAMGGGGGGASWVLKPGNFTATNDVYIVAGGGAGGPGNNNQWSGRAASAANSQGSSSGGGANAAGPYSPGAGAGYGGNGAGGSTSGSSYSGGLSPVNGAVGGAAGYNSSGYDKSGGFGGGGGNGAHSSGGGGGYGGGQAQYYGTQTVATASTPYIMANGAVTVTNRTFSGLNYNNLQGIVTIEQL